MSKISVVPLRLEHLESLSSAKELIESGMSDLVLAADSIAILWGERVMVCLGIGMIWPGRGHTWAAFDESSTAKNNFVPVFRAMKRWFEERLRSAYYRIEMSIDYGLEFSERRARMLGFKCEVERAKMFLPDGRDASIYVMVRD